MACKALQLQDYFQLISGSNDRVSRSPGFDGENRQALMRIAYNGSGDAVKFSRLNAAGKPVMTTRVSYNGKHEITSVSNGETSTSISYNNFGLPTQVTDTFLNSTGYRYDKYNRLASVTIANGVKTHYQYTVEGLISRISRTCPLDDVEDMVKVGKTINGAIHEQIILLCLFLTT